MPDLGGKKFVEDFRTMLKQQVEEAFRQGRAHIQKATDELTQEIVDQSKGAASAIRAEARVIREGFEPTTGNNPTEADLAAEEAEKKKAAAAGGGSLPNPTQQNSGGGTAS